MSDGELRGTETTPLPHGPGQRLRAARLAQGLDVVDIAQRTRIPQRHIETIENGDYAALPSVTYAVGFARAYARAVGVDEAGIASAVRDELAGAPERRIMVPAYEVEEGARAPSRGLVLTGVIVAVLLIAGLGLYYGTNLFRGDGGAPAETAAVTEPASTEVAPAPAAPTPPPAPTGQVALTAKGEVWLHVTDAGNATLFIGTMKAGDRFDIPATANGPMVTVGRPEELTVTVGGQPVAPLGPAGRPVNDVPLDAASLTARQAAPSAP